MSTIIYEPADEINIIIKIVTNKHIINA